MPVALLLAQLALSQAAAQPAAQPPSVTVVAVGHIVMGTSYPPEHPALPPEGGRGIFDPVRPILKNADVAFGNLAAPLSDRGGTKKKVDGINVFAFRTPSSFGAHLKEAGFDVVQAANNHIQDFGSDAYEDTLKNLDQLGIAHVGRKGELFVKEQNGIKVGVLGFTQPYNDFFATFHDLAAATESIREAKKKVDVLVVGLHGGTEGGNSLHTPRGPEYLGSEYRGEVVKSARALVDAGADLVVGFGPHLPRAMEIYQGKLIDYSLGNFLTYGPFNLRGACGLSLVLEARFDKLGNLLASKVHPLVVEKPGLPKPDPAKQTLAHLRTLSQQDFPESFPEIDDEGSIRPHAQAAK